MKAIEVEHLTKIFPGGIKAVDDISFDVDEGEMWGFLSTQQTREDHHHPDDNHARRPDLGVDQGLRPRRKQRPAKVRSMLGYVPQAVSVDGDLTAYENLLIFAKLFDVKKAESA